MKNDNNDEKQMKEWVGMLHEAELENLLGKEPMQETCHLSDTFYAKMKRLVLQQEKKEARTKKMAKCGAAAAIAVLLVTLPLQQVKAQVEGVKVQWQEKMAFFTMGTPKDEAVWIPEYVLTYVPEGFEWVAGEYNGPGYGGGALYYNDTKTLDFEYAIVDASIGVNNEYVILHTITLPGGETRAKYLESTNPRYMSSLLWVSEDGNIAFCITADLDYDELIRIYKGVQIKK